MTLYPFPSRARAVGYEQKSKLTMKGEFNE